MSRQRRAFRSYWSNPNATMSLGCFGCPDQAKCGGQTILGSGFNCLDHCCKTPETCQIVCPHASVFVDRIREVDGLELDTPLTPTIEAPFCPSYMPLLFHGSAIVTELPSSAVAIPLYRFFNKSSGCRFKDRTDVSQFFKIRTTAQIFLSGVAKDEEVERWWRLETKGRIKAIKAFRQLGISMVTTPNFSLMVDRPRWDDLHSMKRIAQVHYEFVSEGLPAALHVNSRKRHDFARWTDYIVSHREVTHIAYEFTTGTKNFERMKQHTQWLIELAQGSGRRLGLILRGGSQVLPTLSQHFDVTFLDSSPFEKAQHREVAYINGCGQRCWLKHLTPKGMPIDVLFHDNVRLSERWLANRLLKFAIAA